MAGIEGSDLDAIIARHGQLALPDPGGRPARRRTAFGSTAMALDISAACAGYCHGIALANDMVRGGTAEQRPRHRRRAALRLHQPRRPRHRVHLRRRRRGGRRQPLRDARHRPDDLGLRRREVGRHLADRELDRRPRAGPRLAAHRHAGPDRLPLGRVGHGPGRAAGPRRRRRHRRPARRVHPAPGQRAHRRRDGQAAQAARPTSPSPATSRTPATRRRPPCRWRWSGWCASGEVPRGGLALQIGFGAGLTYAAQVVVIP